MSMNDARRRPAVRVIAPLRDFLATQAAGGALLAAAAVVAVVWANSPVQASYHEFWESEVALRLAGHELVLDLRHVVNDGLMTLFFFVVGLEIKRELVDGELRDRRVAALPFCAALGGMAVPAALFTLLNAGSAGSRGWGIPMATDIALALGALGLFAPRVHPGLKLFLLTLAIVDDVGAIIVIAVFYAKDLSVGWLGMSAALTLIVVTTRILGVRYVGVYCVFGGFLWLATHEAGVHATMVGVVLGLLAPARPLPSVDLVDGTAIGDLSAIEAAEDTVRVARSTVSVVERLEHRLQPWTSYAVAPLFALANAGLTLTQESASDALGSRTTWGVIVGLVVGKPIGILAGSWLAVRLGLAVLPAGVTWPGVRAAGALAGIGFTVSLFVGGLAFDSADARSDAVVGIALASLVAAAAGGVLLRLDASRKREA
jgi:NhaA family Na+:H+ antiporter